MKYANLLYLFILGFLVLPSGCTKDSCTRTVTHKKLFPIYKTLAEMHAPVTVGASRDLNEPGKIFVSGNYILINELRKGVHIIDNSNPSNPVNVAFLDVPGNMDIAVKGNLLFLDSYFDIVTFDISNPASPVFIGRSKDAFPSSKFRFDESLNAFIVGYDEKIVTETLDCIQLDELAQRFTTDASAPTGIDAPAPEANIAGSMASMRVVNDYLYLITGNKIWIYSIADIPEKLNDVSNSTGRIETLFSYGDKLFVGASNGMYIYDSADPTNPTLLSRFMHYESCDPVFVKDDIAYVTLRNGTPCRGYTNQLDVVDVSNLTNPILIKTYPMYNPHGLSVDDENLYLCEGAKGLKVFGTNDLLHISDNLNKHIPDIEAYDVIHVPERSLLIVIGKDGLYQFSLNNNFELLSKISSSN